MEWNIKEDAPVNKVIWKQQLGSMTKTINIPGGSKALKIAIDPKDNLTYLWFICDPTKKPQNYRVEFFGTGWEIDSVTLRGMKFFDSVITDNGFVWHYFIDDDLIGKGV